MTNKITTDLIIPTGHYILDEMQFNNLNIDKTAELLKINIDSLIKLLAGELMLNEKLANNIENILDIPSQVLLNLEAKYREQLKCAKYHIGEHEYLTKLLSENKEHALH